MKSKLTESDFQTCKAAVAESYRDFDEVFEPELLPRVALAAGRRREAVEFPEDYSQEGESLVDLHRSGLRRFAHIAAGAGFCLQRTTSRWAMRGINSFRNVLAAYARGCSFCVIHDERRPDLREAWFEVMAAVKPAELRVRLKVLTWQELAAALPGGATGFSGREVWHCEAGEGGVAGRWHGRFVSRAAALESGAGDVCVLDLGAGA